MDLCATFQHRGTCYRSTTPIVTAYRGTNECGSGEAGWESSSSSLPANFQASRREIGAPFHQLVQFRTRKLNSWASVEAVARTNRLHRAERKRLSGGNEYTVALMSSEFKDTFRLSRINESSAGTKIPPRSRGFTLRPYARSCVLRPGLVV
jgi:hypothetical protein